MSIDTYCFTATAFYEEQDDQDHDDEAHQSSNAISLHLILKSAFLLEDKLVEVR